MLLRSTGPPAYALRAKSPLSLAQGHGAEPLPKGTSPAPWPRVRDGKEWALAPWRERPDPAARGHAQRTAFSPGHAQRTVFTPGHAQRTLFPFALIFFLFFSG